MNIKYFIRYCVAATILATACNKEPVEIVTLNKGGEAFYFGEKVQVWAGVDGDLSEISYDWNCTGGNFEGIRTQHLYENLWIAPAKPGEYLVEVTAKTSKNSDSRQTRMKVTNYFTEGFDNSQNPAGWASSNTTLSWGKTGSISSLTVPATGTSDANIRRTLTAIPLVPPFSVKTQMGYTKYKKVTNVTSGNGATFFSISFVQPGENQDRPYIREIRWEICPPATGTNKNWRIRMESYTPSTGKSYWSSATGDNTTAPEPFIPGTIDGRDEIFAFGTSELHSFAMTIDENLNFTVSVDGSVWIDKSPAIAGFLNAKGLSRDILLVKEFKITVPRKSSSSAASGETTWYFTNVQVNDANTAIGGDVNQIGFEELK